MTTTTEEQPGVYAALELHDDNTASVTLSHVDLRDLDGVLAQLGSEETRNEILGQVGLRIAARLSDATGIPVPFLLTAAGMALLGQ